VYGESVADFGWRLWVGRMSQVRRSLRAVRLCTCAEVTGRYQTGAGGSWLIRVRGGGVFGGGRGAGVVVELMDRRTPPVQLDPQTKPEQHHSTHPIPLKTSKLFATYLAYVCETRPATAAASVLLSAHVSSTPQLNTRTHNSTTSI
jgi:hypothetical protein